MGSSDCQNIVSLNFVLVLLCPTMVIIKMNITEIGLSKAQNHGINKKISNWKGNNTVNNLKCSRLKSSEQLIGIRRSNVKSQQNIH